MLCIVDETDIKNNFKDSFWRDVIIAWSRYAFDPNPDSVGLQIIWYSPCIKVNNKVHRKQYERTLYNNSPEQAPIVIKHSFCANVRNKKRFKKRID